METDVASSTPAALRHRCDVFLSFIGEDMRHDITQNLYESLEKQGIRVFHDDEGMNRGNEIAPSVLEAIEDSAASIIIISPNYASSHWCLEELAKICKLGRLILPVFYGVDPSNVRRQKGPFEKAFESHEAKFKEEEVKKWREAMEKVGNLSGWVFDVREEQQLIQDLVKKVLTKLSNTPLGVAKYAVGLNSRINELTRMLDIKANGVRVLGVYGMGGVGKTTLAKALYNKLVIHFKRRSFISNDRETSRPENDLMSLQNKLIHDLSLGATPPDSRVMVSYRKVLPEEPVLIVLDDIDDATLLKGLLAGKKHWFYEGSRIIITTRDKGVLSEDIVDEFYEMEVLNFPEALQLLSYHAFGREKPIKDFMKLSEEVVSRVGQLPLALEVFGSFLSNKRTVNDWKDALQELGKIRPGNLQGVLEISFEGLDEQEKCVFLDIACFFVKMKMNKEDAIYVIKGCGFSAETIMTALTAKSLIKIVQDNVLWMHDELRDMGRQIVLLENERDPGMRSRLWDQDDIMTVFKHDKGTRSIQGIALDIENKHELSSEQIYRMNFKRRPSVASATAYLKEIHKNYFHHGVENRKNVMLCNSSFKRMVNLRLLQINNVKLYGNFKFMPPELKWLQWKGCPLRTLPSEFCLQHLAVLDLSDSKITKVWEWRWWNWYSRNKRAEKMLVMNLQGCYNLTEIPDLSVHCALEKLNLERCKALVKVHKSVGDLSTLLYLNLKDCSDLAEFPSDVSGLKHLENLILSGCYKLNELPGDIGSMRSLRELLIDGMAIVKLPDSILHLKKLERFSLRGCSLLKQLPNGIGNLSSLKELSLGASAVEEIPSSIGLLTKLEKLDLMRCRSLTSVPDSIGNLKSLIELYLDNSSVKELPTSIGSLSLLKYLSVGHCRSLSILPDSIGGLASLVGFTLQGTTITEIPNEVGALNMVEKLDMGNCELLKFLPDSVGKMLSMTTLILSNVMIMELPESIGMLERLNMLKLDECKKLQRLPASIGNLKSLQYFLMAETSVTELPDEFGMLSSLTILKMGKQPHSRQSQNIGKFIESSNSSTTENLRSVVLPMSFSNLSSLRDLDACAWKLSGEIPDDFEKLSSLEILNLSHNNFCSLPSSLRGLSLLKDLDLTQCKELKSLPPLPSRLLKLMAANCTALEIISDLTTLESLQELNLTNCNKITDIPGLQYLKSLRRLYMSGCNACFPAVKGKLAKVALKHLRNLSVPGSEIPNWFVQEIPRLTSPKNRDIMGIIIGVVVSLDQRTQDTYRNKLKAIVDIQAKIIRLNDPIYTTTLYLMGVPNTDEDQIYLCRYMEFNPLVFMLKEGDKIQIATRERPYFNGLKLKKYGIQLVFEYDDDIDDDDYVDEYKQSVSEKLAKFIGSL